MASSKKPEDLSKDSSRKDPPALSERDLEKVSGGFIVVPDIKGPSKRDGHEDEIG